MTMKKNGTTASGGKETRARHAHINSVNIPYLGVSSPLAITRFEFVAWVKQKRTSCGKATGPTTASLTIR